MRQGVRDKEFRPEAFQEAVRRLVDGKDHGSEPARPDFDPQQAKELAAAVTTGNRPETYQQVLEHFGFRFFPDAVLMRAGMLPTGEGCWRQRKLQLAFKPSDLSALFPNPEAFDRWMRAKVAEKKLGKMLQDKPVERPRIVVP